MFPLVHKGEKKIGEKLSNSLIGFQNSLWGERQAGCLPSYTAWCVL